MKRHINDILVSVYVAVVYLLCSFHFLSATEVAPELNNYYFATKTMSANKIKPMNLYGKSLDKNSDDAIETKNTVIKSIEALLNNNQKSEMVGLIEITQNIRELFSKKRRDQDIENLLKSNLSIDTYRNSFGSLIGEIKSEYLFNIKVTVGIICAIFFGARYVRGMYDPCIVTILSWSSQSLGVFFIMHQCYQWALLYIKYRILSGG